MVDRNRDTMGSARTNQPASTASSATGQAKEQVQQKAADMKEQVQQTAADVKEQVATQATDKLADQKDAASGSLNTVAHAFRQTGEQLRDNDQMGIASYVERAADQVEQFAGYLGNRDIRALTRDAEAFARREPALFLGGAFALGIVAARFLKSSGQASQGGSQGTGRYWQGQADWYGQRPSPQVTPPPQLPAHTASSASPSFAAGRPAPMTSGIGATPAGGVGATPGRMTPPTGGTGTTGTGATAQAGRRGSDAIVGGPPLPTDVIVGGPPHEPGRGGQR